MSTMHLMTLAIATMLAVFPAMAATPATTRLADPVDAMRWQRRMVIVFANDATRAKLAQQREWLANEAAGLAERRLAIVEVVGDAMTIDGAAAAIDAPALARLRERFDARPESFRVVLVGLDGGEKLRRDGPVWPALLFETIDAMPMRQREAKGD